MNLTKSLAAVGLGLWCTFGCAQQPASAAGTGTVTGYVTCGDTQRPARLAHVVLFEVPKQVTTLPKLDPIADSAARMAAMAEAMKAVGKTNMAQAQTGTDGAYTVTDVTPGDYYVFAAASGYVSPLNQVQALIDGGADVKKPLPGVQVVHVSAEHTVTADVTMDRGAAVSGTILWDDGSPVTGAIMAVAPAKGDSKQPPSQFGMLALANVLGTLSVSDDLGHFRISGLAPGDYVVKATVQTGHEGGLGTGMNLNKFMSATPLVVYLPAVFHKVDAKTVTLHTAEDLRDQMMTLNLGGMHSVSGRVSSIADRHGINSATVRLQDSTDKEFTRSASVDANGTFTVTFVPPGTYTMKVTDAEDTEPIKKTDKEKTSIFSHTKTIRSYKDGSSNVIVTDSDLTGQNMELRVDSSTQQEPDLGKLFEDDDEKPAPK